MDAGSLQRADGIEEEEESGSEEELDYDVEYVELMGAGGDASGSRLASGIAVGWPPGYEFMAVWTVHEMACFFMSPGGNVPVNMQFKLQQSVRMTVVCLAFSSSSELDITVVSQ